MRSSGLIVVLLALVSSLLAARPAASKYSTLLSQLQAGNVQIDYTAFRMACAADDNCAEGADAGLRQKMFESLQQNDPGKVLEAAQAVLKSCYADIDGQILAAAAYGRMGNTAKQQFHRAIAHGLVESILKSGNGRSAATGYVVISINEEYSILRVLGLRPTRQGYGKAQGHWYDNFEAVSMQTGKPVPTLYFQIDIVHAREMKAMAVRESDPWPVVRGQKNHEAVLPRAQVFPAAQPLRTTGHRPRTTGKLHPMRQPGRQLG